MNNNVGSLISFHFHDNFETLNKISDVNGILYYQNNPIFPPISEKENNCLTLIDDGLFVDNNSEEVLLLREQNALLIEEINQLSALLDIVNRVVIT